MEAKDYTRRRDIDPSRKLELTLFRWPASRQGRNLLQQIVIPSTLAQRIDTAAGKAFYLAYGDVRSPREATCPSIASWSPRTLHVFLQLDPIREIIPSYRCRPRAGLRRCSYRRGPRGRSARSTRRRAPGASEHTGHIGDDDQAEDSMTANTDRRDFIRGVGAAAASAWTGMSLAWLLLADWLAQGLASLRALRSMPRRPPRP